jgi:xylulose-5-phosphate/fructose-6-phosphate phosphoketolase
MVSWPIDSFTQFVDHFTVWRQDHNGLHQDPGFLDVVVNKRAEVTRIYLPPDVNSLLSVADHCLLENL